MAKGDWMRVSFSRGGMVCREYDAMPWWIKQVREGWIVVDAYNAGSQAAGPFDTLDGAKVAYDMLASVWPR